MGKQPNIVMFVSDQQRWDTLSAYGTDCICRTPHIDALAGRGTLFNSAFTPSALCSPARAALFTGLYPHKNGVARNDGTIADGVKTLAHYLQEAGYGCGYSGKWHIDKHRGPSQFGFLSKDFLGYGFPGAALLPGFTFNAAPDGRVNHYADYLKERGYDIPTVKNRFVGNNPTNNSQEMFALHDGPVETCIEYFVTEQMINNINELSTDDKPFFVWANYWGPHSPSLVPEPYFSMYDPKDIPEHPSYCETFEKKPGGHKLCEKYWGLGDYGWEGFQQIAARYFGHCTLIDDMVGRVVDHLKRENLLDNTVIIFTTDHGDCMGAHKLIEKGPFMYDETYKIPLVVALPGNDGGGYVNDDFVYLHDLTPTILDIAGIPVPDNMDGVSLTPILRGRPEECAASEREEVYCMLDRHFFTVDQRMVRTKTHQFTFTPGDIGELYDLVRDPYQLNNVYDNPEYDAVRRDLIARMEKYMTELKDWTPYGWFKGIIGAY